MKLSPILCEIREDLHRPVICVDVQPEYANAFYRGYAEDCAEFLKGRMGEVLMLVNAEETGASRDTMQEIQWFWYELGVDEDTIEGFTWHDKGYGHLRSWMDYGIHEDEIITVIKEMYRQRVQDSRELFDQDQEKLAEYFVSIGIDEDDVKNLIEEPLVVGWLDLPQLKSFNGCYIFGGGREECLKETLIMMDALGMNYEVIEELVYT